MQFSKYTRAAISQTLAISAAVVLSTMPAHAIILDPVIDFVTDILADLQTLVTIIAVVVFIISGIAAWFGAANAGRLAFLAILIAVVANAEDIVSAITG